MKLKIFTIYDSKTETFDRPIFAKTTNEMIRDLTSAVNNVNPNNKLHLYPSDLTLFDHGEYDDSTGTFTLLDTPHSMFLLHDLKTASNETPNG